MFRPIRISDALKSKLHRGLLSAGTRYLRPEFSRCASTRSREDRQCYCHSKNDRVAGIDQCYCHSKSDRVAGIDQCYCHSKSDRVAGIDQSA